MLTRLFAAKWLGHGRMMEGYLASVALLIGLSLLLKPNENPTNWDLVWSFGTDRFLAGPFLLKAMLNGIGLVGNIRGWQWSKELRYAGALLGSMLWFFVGLKLAIAQTFIYAFPFCLVSFVASIRIMGLAASNLPRPKAPGQLQ